MLEQISLDWESEGGKEIYYHVRHLERVRNMPYPKIVDKISALLGRPPLKGNAVLVIDQTGVGAPVIDLFRQAGLNPIGVLIHGGDKVSNEAGTWRVPKRDLVGALQVLFQAERLKIASKLALASILQTELLNFKVKIDPVTAHDSYSAWREADHDDLVLSVALAAWLGEKCATIPRIDYSLIKVETVIGGEMYGDDNWLPLRDYII